MWVDILEPILRVHNAMDEGRERLAVVIGHEPSPQTDLQPEAVGHAMDQLDPRHGHLSAHQAAHAVDRMIAANADLHAVRKARQLGVREAVLMEAGEQAVDRAAAHLEHGLEVPGQRIGHGCHTFSGLRAI
jgi:hypothetical protein